MKRFLALLLAAAFVFTACQSGGAATGEKIEGYAEVQELTYLYAAEIPTLNYYDNGSESVYANIAKMVDGLIEYDRYGVVRPAVAETWEVSEDGLVWTFHLRDGVTWVDSQGNYVADVTANDFVSAAMYCLDYEKASYYSDFYLNYFVGARQYYGFKDPDYTGGDATDDFSQVGVKALDDYTVEYTLTEPVPYFLTMMNWVPFYPVYGPFLEEMGQEFGASNDKILYNGAMRFETWQPSDTRVYVKNDSYYLKDEVYVTKFTYKYNAEQEALEPDMFIRGEVDQATFTNPAMLDEWLADPERASLVRPESPSHYSYFYAFNFDPQFDAEYEPENWKLAVNNRDFRLALFHAFNRLQAAYTDDPYNPEIHLIKTITPSAFTDVGGLDYVEVGALNYVSNEMPTFDEALAKEYRDAAKTALEAAGATFPVKVMLPYNTQYSDWGQRSQVVKQGLETVLGQDFIQVEIVAAAPTDFLANYRRNGNFALLECNWGPDYADPETYSDPFNESGTYNKPHMADGYTDENGVKTYTNLLNTAKAERVDIEKRYELFAEAEAFLIEEAFVIPYVRSVPEWVASYFNPFESNYSTGSAISGSKINNWRKLNSPMDADQYTEAYNAWQEERAAALKASAE